MRHEKNVSSVRVEGLNHKIDLDKETIACHAEEKEKWNAER